MALVTINDKYTIETRGIVSIVNTAPSEILIRYQGGDHVRMVDVSMTEVMAKLRPKSRFKFTR